MQMLLFYSHIKKKAPCVLLPSIFKVLTEWTRSEMSLNFSGASGLHSACTNTYEKIKAIESSESTIYLDESMKYQPDTADQTFFQNIKIHWCQKFLFFHHKQNSVSSKNINKPQRKSMMKSSVKYPLSI